MATGELFIVANYNDGKLKTIFPFQRSGSVLTSLCDHKTDYNTIFIGEDLDLTSLLSFLYTQGIEEVYLRNIVKEHEFYIPPNVPKQLIFCPVVSLKEKIIKNEKLQKELISKKKKVAKMGEIRHEIELTSPNLTEVFLSLHSNWWNSKSQTGLYHTHSERTFLNQVLLEFSKKRQSFYSVFYINEEIASILLLFKLNENRLGYYFGGHNLKFKKFKIGLLHIEALISNLSSSSPYLYFDFLRGNQVHKYHLGGLNENYVFNCCLNTKLMV